MDIEIVDMPAFRAGAIRGDLGHAFETWGRLGEIAGAAGLFQQPGALPASLMPVEVLTHGPQTAHEDVTYAAAVFVPDGTELPDGLIEVQVPGGQFARATYIGSYEGLGGAWGEFAGQWLPASGHQVSGEVCYEIYRTGPGEAPEDELRTELYIPIA